MSTSNNWKKPEFTKKTWKIIIGSCAGVLLAGVIFFFTYYNVEHVEVMGSSHYTKEEVREMILRGPLASNSVLAPLLYSRDDAGDIPFVEGFRVKQVSRNTIAISVKEKKPVGCIPYLDSYVYFDRNGIFIESSVNRVESVPYFDGIQVSHVIKDEKLPIKGTTVLNTAVALATIFEKNQTIPDHIVFDQNYQISLVYGDITVQLGKDENLEEKMARAIAILPQLTGEKGILHLENVTDSAKNTFEREIEEVTSENWNGGYDEDGNYTGVGEYDENGNYVGPKPMTALDYALESWPGGYDEEGDYTGAGEYDESGNYVGPAPTQETMDANGDWLGGYDENGRFITTGEYDREGNYVGPRPENAGAAGNGSGNGTGEDAESGSYGDTEGDWSEASYDGTYDNSYDGYYGDSYGDSYE